jgi:hypothetical protein
MGGAMRKTMQPVFAQVRRMAIGIRVLMVLGMTAFAVPAIAEPSFRGTVFDSKIMQNLKVNGQTRAQIARITAASGAELQRVLNKYKINPRGKLNFEKMMEASSELEAVQRTEREAMRKVLTPEQFFEYEKINSATSRRVRRAMK